MLFAIGYTLFIWLVMYLGRYQLVALFDATGQAASLIVQYCQWIALGFVFNGFLFIANATFNNINAAHMATMFNFSRSLLGTIPFVYLFSSWWGPVGVLVGEIFGAVIFGSFALIIAFKRINRLVAKHTSTADDASVDKTEEDVITPNTPPWAYSSARSSIGQQTITDSPASGERDR